MVAPVLHTVAYHFLHRRLNNHLSCTHQFRIALCFGLSEEPCLSANARRPTSSLNHNNRAVYVCPIPYHFALMIPKTYRPFDEVCDLFSNYQRRDFSAFCSLAFRTVPRWIVGMIYDRFDRIFMLSSADTYNFQLHSAACVALVKTIFLFFLTCVSSYLRSDPEVYLSHRCSPNSKVGWRFK